MPNLEITKAEYTEDTASDLENNFEDSNGYADYDIEGTVGGTPFTATLSLELDGRDASADVEGGEDEDGEEIDSDYEVDIGNNETDDLGQTLISIATAVLLTDGFGPAAERLAALHSEIAKQYLCE